MRTTIWLRFCLLVTMTIALIYVCVLEVLEALQSGASSLPIGRHGSVLHFTRADNPLAFYASVALFGGVALTFLGFAARQVSALIKPREAANEQFIREQIAAIERTAPTGLRPLWIGLAIAAGCALVYLILGDR